MKFSPALFACLLMVCLLAGACRKVEIEGAVPDCVKAKIRKIKQERVQSPPAQVDRIEVDGKTYYGFSDGCCDMFYELYDEDCRYVCAPSGGLTGQGDGQCPIWNGVKETTLVWKDPR